MPDLNSTYKISLDFYNKNIVSINAKQLDTKSRCVEVTCTEHGKKYVVDASTTTAILRFKKANGNSHLENVKEITTRGTIIFELSEQLLSASGRCVGDIMLLGTSDSIDLTDITSIEDIVKKGYSILSTMSFYINTEKTAINYDDIKLLEDDYNAINSVLAAGSSLQILENTVTASEAERKNNETTRQENENERQKKELARQNAESKRVDNEGIRQETEAARQVKEIERNNLKISMERTLSEMQSTLDDINSTLSYVIDDNTSSSTKTYSSQKIEGKFSEIINIIYPVGSIYMSVNSANPSNLFGGTWVAWGEGRVPVGIGPLTLYDKDGNPTGTSLLFDSEPESRGGEIEHTLTVEEMPSHTHNNFTGATQLHINGNAFQRGYSGDTGNQIPSYATGGGQPHNNLQPYITCYMWKRTA